MNPTGSGPAFNPVVSGATLELHSPGVPSVALAMPASGWSDGGRSFKFRNSEAPGGISAVRAATVIPSKSIKLTAARTGFTLAAPLTGVGIRLVSGVAAACTIFPPSAVVTNTSSEFAAKGPTVVPDDCDQELLRRAVPNGDLNPRVPNPLPPPIPPDPPLPWLMSTGSAELLPSHACDWTAALGAQLAGARVDTHRERRRKRARRTSPLRDHHAPAQARVAASVKR